MSFKLIPVLSTTIATAILFSGLYSCKKETMYYPLTDTVIVAGGGYTPSSIAIRSLTPGTIEADGATQSIVTLKIQQSSVSTNKQISLSTTIGTFNNGRPTDTVTADINGLATFSLTSLKVGKAKLTASYNGTNVDTLIEFKAALPNDFNISSSLYTTTTTPTTKVTVTTTFLRDPFKGVVTDPVKVFYQITPDVSQPDQLVYPSVDFSINRASVITITNPFLIKGSFTVEAKTLTATGDTLRKSFRLKFT